MPKIMQPYKSCKTDFLFRKSAPESRLNLWADSLKFEKIMLQIVQYKIMRLGLHLLYTLFVAHSRISYPPTNDKRVIFNEWAKDLANLKNTISLAFGLIGGEINTFWWPHFIQEFLFNVVQVSSFQ